MLYFAVLDIYGRTSSDDWLMQLPDQEGNLGNGGPDSVSKIPGGKQLVFASAITLNVPNDEAETLVGENVIDAHASYGYTPLRYANGGITITTADCHYRGP